MSIKKAELIFAVLLINLISLPSFSCPSTGYTIGVQAINYTPHYNFVTSDKANFFSAFVDWLTIKTGCQFNVIALPIKRLNLTFEKQRLDFIYPDNPTWHQHNQDKSKLVRQYSPAIAIALGGTMVRQEQHAIALSEFNELAIPRGFSPVAWYPLQREYPIKFREVSDAEAALLMVQERRVSGADIEYNVAQHIIKTSNLVPMSIGDNLPFTPTGFHLTTATQPEMLKIINNLIRDHQEELKQMRIAVNLLEEIPINK